VVEALVAQPRFARAVTAAPQYSFCSCRRGWHTATMNDDELGYDGLIAPTARTTVRRLADRARYERATVNAILDEGIVAHVGFVADTGVCVLPMAYGRIDDRLYLHGATGNAMLRSLSGGDVSVTVTLLDGLVLSRSAFHHSMNYRSVVVFGRAEQVVEPDEVMEALLAVVDHVAAGRSEACRRPTPSEVRKTRVVRLRIDEASAKVRTGPPVEEPDDLGLAFWGGVVPVTTTFGTAIADDFVAPGAAAPVY
jgi:nitroimidazol reductase NimA-like FMN-containing flavoprotein (pyridoxamine 5'-phosphate oxidase superfamily)